MHKICWLAATAFLSVATASFEAAAETCSERRAICLLAGENHAVTYHRRDGNRHASPPIRSVYDQAFGIQRVAGPTDSELKGSRGVDRICKDEPLKGGPHERTAAFPIVGRGGGRDRDTGIGTGARNGTFHNAQTCGIHSGFLRRMGASISHRLRTAGF